MPRIRARALGMASLLLTAALVLNLAGCAITKSQADSRRNTALTKATENYQKLIRWGLFEAASRYVKTREGESVVPDLAVFAPWSVTKYTMGEVRRGTDPYEVHIAASIEFYRKDTRIIANLRDEQLWWYDIVLESWFLGTSMPDFASAAQRPR